MQNKKYYSGTHKHTDMEINSYDKQLRGNKNFRARDFWKRRD